MSQKMSNEQEMCCLHKSGKIGKFMDACILLLLYKESDHGYGLVQRLEGYGFEEDTVNASTLYRCLRKMEKDGLIESDWQQGGQGPKKRVYHITGLGKEQMKMWSEMMKDRKNKIELYLKDYSKSVEGQK
ncbi:MAG TPA: PadR family transcriptional regulator [Eubacteriaceae bacterium]|nr:PadR family transcriptional regulator [Eubacteriaceae bacterium]